MNERAWKQKEAEAIVSVALARLGEGEEPPGSNRGPLPDKCIRFVGLEPTGKYAWCAGFACLCVFDAGIVNGPRSASTGRIHTWAAVNGALVEEPREGDIGCVISLTSLTGYRHTVIVVHNFGDGVVHTVAGNENNRVQTNTYPLGMLHFVRPYA